MGKYPPMPKKTGGGNSHFGFKSVGDLVSYSKSDIAGSIFAWSFRVAAEAGLRWDDLLNTAPATLVLLKEGLVGFAAKTKTRGKSDGRHWGAQSRIF